MHAGIGQGKAVETHVDHGSMVGQKSACVPGQNSAKRRAGIPPAPLGESANPGRSPVRQGKRSGYAGLGQSSARRCVWLCVERGQGGWDEASFDAQHRTATSRCQNLRPPVTGVITANDPSHWRPFPASKIVVQTDVAVITEVVQLRCSSTKRRHTVDPPLPELADLPDPLDPGSRHEPALLRRPAGSGVPASAALGEPMEKRPIGGWAKRAAPRARVSPLAMQCVRFGAAVSGSLVRSGSAADTADFGHRCEWVTPIIGWPISCGRLSACHRRRFQAKFLSNGGTHQTWFWVNVGIGCFGGDRDLLVTPLIGRLLRSCTGWTPIIFSLLFFSCGC